MSKSEDLPGLRHKQLKYSILNSYQTRETFPLMSHHSFKKPTYRPKHPKYPNQSFIKRIIHLHYIIRIVHSLIHQHSHYPSHNPHNSKWEARETTQEGLYKSYYNTHPQFLSIHKYIYVYLYVKVFTK